MAGFILKADEEGVRMLNGMADGIEYGTDRIVEQTDALLDEVEQYRALGPHINSIKNIVALIQEETKNSSAPARVVAQKLRKKAQDYQDWIDDDLFGDLGN